jgi:hypothetical protein
MMPGDQIRIHPICVWHGVMRHSATRFHCSRKQALNLIGDETQYDSKAFFHVNVNLPVVLVMTLMMEG